MHGTSDGTDGITADLVLQAYATGIFPMADSADDPGLYWVEPEERGVIPIDGFHVPRRLARTVRSDRFQVDVDRDFGAVIAGCASVSICDEQRRATWINHRIRRLYGELFRRGFVHTVEVRRDDKLVGGLYGLSLGGAFFGESMFSHERDASKVALVHLAGRLIAGGYVLLDTQFLTTHLEQFGAVSIPKSEYRDKLVHALSTPGDFFRIDLEADGPHAAQYRQPKSGKSVLQLINQTS